MTYKVVKLPIKSYQNRIMSYLRLLCVIEYIFTVPYSVAIRYETIYIEAIIIIRNIFAKTKNI